MVCSSTRGRVYAHHHPKVTGASGPDAVSANPHIALTFGPIHSLKMRRAHSSVLCLSQTNHLQLTATRPTHSGGTQGVRWMQVSSWPTQLCPPWSEGGALSGTGWRCEVKL